MKPCDALKKSGLEPVLLDSTMLKKYLKKSKIFLAGKKPVFLHLLIISDSCLRHFQSPAVMSLITEKDVHGFSAVHYAAKKGDIKV